MHLLFVAIVLLSSWVPESFQVFQTLATAVAEKDSNSDNTIIAVISIAPYLANKNDFSYDLIIAAISRAPYFTNKNDFSYGLCID